MSAKRIAVIGAGASGLTAIKCCLDEGLEPVCFEKSGDIGGLWRYETGEKIGATVYRSTIINTSKELMSFSDFPLPKECPNFMHNRRVQEYYREYAAKFNLLPHIQFHTVVICCSVAEDHDVTGRWCLQTKNTQTGDVKKTTFDGVMVAIGHHAEPHFPIDSFKGADNIRNKTIHSHAYRDFKGFEDKNVLIIGIGNSAVDIAVELSWHAKQVYLSTRRGAWVFKRMGPHGVPIDFVAITRYRKVLQDMMPQSWLRSALETGLTENFDHSHYGLRPEHGPLNQHPTTNDDLPVRIMNGSIKVKTNVKEFGDDFAIFEDGTKEPIDRVVFATGYKYSFPFLPENIAQVDGTECRLYKYMWPLNMKHDTLAMIGHVQVLGALNPVSEMQSRWATRVFKGLVDLPTPDVMIGDIEKKRHDIKRTFYHTQRHSIEVEHVGYMDEIAEQIGVKPNLFKLFFTDYQLAYKIFYEICSPYQFRLTGPGRWEHAREAIMTQKKRMFHPFHTRPVRLQEKRASRVPFMLVAIAAFLLYFLVPLLKSKL